MEEITNDSATTSTQQPDESNALNEANGENGDIFIFDPSEHFRPEHKSKAEFRVYTTNQVCF